MAGREVVIAHALFTHGPDRRVALRGSTIEVDEDDYDRGFAAGAFVAETADLQRHGTLPDFPEDDDDVAERIAWVRSATAEEVVALVDEQPELAAVVLGAELVGRGSEARPEVVERITASLGEHGDPEDEEVNSVPDSTNPAAPDQRITGAADNPVGSAPDQRPTAPANVPPGPQVTLTGVLAEPGQANVKTVLAELQKAGNDPQVAARLIELERAGQGRRTLLDSLEEIVTASTKADDI